MFVRIDLPTLSQKFAFHEKYINLFLIFQDIKRNIFIFFQFKGVIFILNFVKYYTCNFVLVKWILASREHTYPFFKRIREESMRRRDAVQT